MSLDDPWLSTAPAGSGDQSRLNLTDTTPKVAQTPDDLIALAEQEQADRRARNEAARSQRLSVPLPPTAPGATRSRKRKARKVRRIIRRVDAWSVLKVSLLFFFCVYLIGMVAGVLLWSAAQQAGTIEGFEGFIADLGAYETFTFEGAQIFNGALVGGLVLVLAFSGGAVLLAVLFNLISDLTGGVRVTVIEEDQAIPTRERRPGGDGDRPPQPEPLRDIS